MTPADVGPATDLILRNDWGDRRLWFEFATSQSDCHPIVAESGGAIVATAVGSANGPVGWIGAIFVAPERRGAGLGRAMTEAVIAALEAARCRTLLLVSTTEARPLYERLGFALDTLIHVFEAPGLPAASERDRPPDPPAVRAFATADLPGMTALDALATGEARGHLLRRFATPESAKVVADGDGSVRGFVVRASWGGGATIARDPGAALAILEARRRASGPAGRTRAGIVESNDAGAERLRAVGFTRSWSAPRFIRGEPLDWRPDWIWGQFNMAIG
jgi:GNAT superfamily N-acetyltransferase